MPTTRLTASVRSEPRGPESGSCLVCQICALSQGVTSRPGLSSFLRPVAAVPLSYGDGVEGGRVGFWDSDSCLIFKKPREAGTIIPMLHVRKGLPWWLRQYGICLQCRRPGFDPWVGKIPWRREWQPTPVFLPGGYYGRKSLAGCSLCDHKESDTNE